MIDCLNQSPEMITNVDVGTSETGRPGLAMWLLCLGWVGLMIAGVMASVDYQWDPAVSGQAPAHWPQAVRLTPPQEKPVLLLFLHPHCPCSQASLTELIQIVKQIPGKAVVQVVFFASRKLAIPAEASNSWSKAIEIPGARVTCDENGEISRRFGAHASGTVLLYSAVGDLQFFGGVTAGRGHVGINSGTMTILRLLKGATLDVQQTPVYGCSMTPLSTECREVLQ